MYLKNNVYLMQKDLQKNRRKKLDSTAQKNLL